MRCHRRTPVHNAAGLTLVELLVSITITALIMGVLVNAAIIFFQHSTDSSKAYDDDNSVQLLQAVFVADAQSAQRVVKDDPSPCGATAPALVSFVRDDAGVTITASWSLETTGGRQALIRRRCTNGTTTERADVAGVSGTPTVGCTPSCAEPRRVTITGTSTNGATFAVTGTRRAAP